MSIWPYPYSNRGSRPLHGLRLMKLSLYVFSLVLALGFANASSLFQYFKPTVDPLPFEKAKVCECINAVELYHQELFDPTLMMFVKSLCPREKTEVSKNYVDFFFNIYKYWSIKNGLFDFDRKDPNSWEVLINDAFFIIAQEDQKLAVDFIKTVVFPSRELIRRIRFELDLNDFLNNSDKKIISYLRKKIFEKFVETVAEILSVPNVAESNLRFKKLLSCANYEINMMTHLAAQNFSSLSAVSIEQLRNVNLRNVEFENVHELVEYLLENKITGTECKSNETTKKYTGRMTAYWQKAEIRKLRLDQDFGDDSDQEQSFSFDSRTIRRHMAVDQRMSSIRRPLLKVLYKLRYKSDENPTFGTTTLFGLLKGETGVLNITAELDEDYQPEPKTELFTFDFGQKKVIDYIINSSSKESELLWDFIESSYHKPHVYDYQLMYTINRPPFAVRHGNLTKTFLNSLIYSALIRFNKIFPESAMIMNSELGLNPELLDQVTAKDFVNSSDNPYDILLRIALWNHEETFDLFHETFGPAKSPEVVNRLFYKAYKSGNQYIIDYVFETYKLRIPYIADSLLKIAAYYYDDKLVHYIVDSNFNLNDESLNIAGKYAIVFNDIELSRMVSNRIENEELRNGLKAYADSMSRNYFIELI